jgi:hypothetical protein
MQLVTAITYSAAAGFATEVLLAAIQEGHVEAPAKEAGTETYLARLAKKCPDVLRPPNCPEPLAGRSFPLSAPIGARSRRGEHRRTMSTR